MGFLDLKVIPLKQMRKEAISKIHTLKCKKAKEKQRDILRYITIELNAALLEGITPYLKQRHEATVLMDGTDVMAKSEFGTINLYAMNDILSKSWYESTCCVEFKEGDVITFEITCLNITDGRINWIAGNIEGGHLDQQKYEELCKRDDLAFFKKPDGSMTGLFK